MNAPPPAAARRHPPGHRRLCSGVAVLAPVVAVLLASLPAPAVRALTPAAAPAGPMVSPATATPAGPPPAAVAGPSLLPAVPGAAPGAPPLLDDDAFAKALKQADLEGLYTLCRQTAAEDRRDRLRELQARLLAIHPAPQPLAVVLANAEALLGCLAPEGALTVLDRIGPAPGPERIQWLVVQWRAASAALDHRRASLALDRLAVAVGPGRSLDTVALPMRRRDDGTVPTRSALAELAEHLAARGLTREAAQVLLSSRLPGLPGAERLRLAAGWGSELSLEQREALLEQALDQAAALGAWGLVNDLLDDQLGLPVARARERRLRLAPRLDDAYGEWLLRQGDPASTARARELEGRLRSPRAPGGHAAELPDPFASPPPKADATAGEAVDAAPAATDAPPAPAFPLSTPSPAPWP